MKVQSKLPFNTSLLSQHGGKSKDGQVVIGGGAPRDVILPAGATMEIADKLWKDYFAAPAEAMLENGDLVILVPVELTEAEQEAADAAEMAAMEARAKELEAKKKKATK